MMRSNPTLSSFIAHALVDQFLHPLDELRRCQSAFWCHGPPKLAIHHVAHALEHTPQQSLRQSFFAILFGGLLFFGHELDTNPETCEFALPLQKTQSILTAPQQQLDYLEAVLF